MGDLVDVLEIVESVSDWSKLGMTLGLLYHPTLTDIETYRRGKPEDCKKDMLSAWLQRKDNVGQAIQGVLLDEIRRDEALTHFNSWAVLLVKTVNQTNE